MSDRDLSNFFTVQDFAAIKMPMRNGRILTDCVRLDEVIPCVNGLIREIVKQKIESLEHELKQSKK